MGNTADRSIHTCTSKYSENRSQSCGESSYSEASEGNGSSPSSIEPVDDRASEGPYSPRNILQQSSSTRGPSSLLYTSQLCHEVVSAGPSSSSSSQKEAHISSSPGLAAPFSLSIGACDCIKATSNDENRRGLQEHVLEWGVHNIMDDRFLANQVKVIPTQFESLGEYFDSFKWPLLEEVRAQIKQSLELLYNAPYVRLTRICKCKTPKNSPLPKTFKRFQFYFNQEAFGNTQQKHETQCRFKPKDLLLSSNKPPGSVRLESSKGGHILAFVENNDRPSLLKVLGLRSCEEALVDKEKTWYAIALNPAVDMGKPIFDIIQKTLKYYSAQGIPREDETPSTQYLKQNIESYCSTRLNESQTNAIVTTIADVQSGLNSGVRMIQGPPGTGKTSTVVTLLSVAASSHLKCLVTSPTNTAIAEVALWYLEMLEDPEKMQFGEFCKRACFSRSSSAQMANTSKILEKRDLLLVGNEKRLPLEGKLAEIYLPR